MKTHEGVEVWVQVFLTSALDGCEWSVSRYGLSQFHNRIYISIIMRLLSVDLNLSKLPDMSVTPQYKPVTSTKDEVFWVITPCSIVLGYQRFGRRCCLHLQGVLEPNFVKSKIFQRWSIMDRNLYVTIRSLEVLAILTCPAFLDTPVPPSHSLLFLLPDREGSSACDIHVGKGVNTASGGSLPTIPFSPPPSKEVKWWCSLLK
jgi:hypothetical protein